MIITVMMLMLFLIRVVMTMMLKMAVLINICAD